MLYLTIAIIRNHRSTDEMGKQKKPNGYTWYHKCTKPVKSPQLVANQNDELQTSIKQNVFNIGW